MVEEIVAGVVVGLIFIGQGWVWRKRLAVQAWFAANEAKARTSKELVQAEETKDLREKVLKVAGTLGVKLPVSSTGSGNPTVVTFSDGDRHAWVPASPQRSLLPSELVEESRPDGVPRTVIWFADSDGFISNVECVYYDEARNEWPDPARCWVRAQPDHEAVRGGHPFAPPDG
jgi:hypothetical protein